MISHKKRDAEAQAEQAQLLWNEFAIDPSKDVKHRLLLQYIGLVRYVLNGLNLAPNKVLSEEDFLQVGILGLYDAIERFDLERGIKFETFAVPRIRGNILDEVRRLDWLSRTTRKRSQELLQAADDLRSEYGREVSSEEIRIKLDLSVSEYRTYLQAAAAATSSLSLNDSQVVHTSDEDEDEGVLKVEQAEDVEYENVLTQITSQELVDEIADYLQKLPERQRLIMTLYYYENITFKEIGALLKITESRVCQIHAQVVSNLRKKVLADV